MRTVRVASKPGVALLVTLVFVAGMAGVARAITWTITYPPNSSSWKYCYQGYKPSNGTVVNSTTNNGSEPYPLRWWLSGPAPTMVWYKVGSTMGPAGFTLPIYNAAYSWSSVDGTAFQFYEDSGHAGTQYEHTLGMATMPVGFLGMTQVMDVYEPTYDATLHRFKLNNVYWRFRSNMSSYKDGTWTWGNTDAYHVIDRESIVAHEMGHALTLNDVTYIVLNSKRTMYFKLYGNDGSEDRTGTWMQSPSIDDAIGLNTLY